MGNTCDSKPVPSAKPVLVYWALHGRSDFCQAMLYAGGVPFELDETTANAWPASKADTPFGQVPVLKHGEMTIGQGGAINRYCARIAGLYPTDVQEAAVCDMFIEEVMDIFGAIFKVRMNESNRASSGFAVLFASQYFQSLQRNDPTP